MAGMDMVGYIAHALDTSEADIPTGGGLALAEHIAAELRQNGYGFVDPFRVALARVETLADNIESCYQGTETVPTDVATRIRQAIGD